MGCGGSTPAPAEAPAGNKPVEKAASASAPAKAPAPAPAPAPASAPASAPTAPAPAAAAAPAPTAAAESLDFVVEREVVINASVDKCWDMAKDWGLAYLMKYDESVKVVVGEEDGKKTRVVTLALGTIEETLESCDDAKKCVVYTMKKSFLPYSKHKVTLAVKTNPNDGAMCILDWRSDIVALTNIAKSKHVAEKGLDGAVLVFKKSLE